MKLLFISWWNKWPNRYNDTYLIPLHVLYGVCREHFCKWLEHTAQPVEAKATIKRQQPPPAQLPLQKAPAHGQLQEEVTDKVTVALGEAPANWTHPLGAEKGWEDRALAGFGLGMGEPLLLPAGTSGPLAWVVPEWLLCPQFPVLQHPPTRWESLRHLVCHFKLQICVASLIFQYLGGLPWRGGEWRSTRAQAMPSHAILSSLSPDPSIPSSESRAWHYCQTGRKMRLSEPCLQYFAFPVTKKWKLETFGTEADRLLHGWQTEHCSVLT